MKKHLIILTILCLSLPLFAVDITINPAKEKHPISAYIYGVNQDIAADVKITARRLGGNRTTGYNWENNASNAGNDWQHYSDNWLMENYGADADLNDKPGGLLMTFHDKSIQRGAYSLITLPLAGYVAKDQTGPVQANEVAPSHRWAKVVFEKEGELKLDPDTGDCCVYLDEELNFLINKYGKSDTATGVKGYALDNEADLWAGTHPRLHPNKTGAEEYINQSVAAAKMIKKMDARAEVFGPASYGFNGFKKWQDAPDFREAQWKYGWYLAYYLARMKEASDKEGKRLLDVLDVHWYPEAMGAGKRIVFSGNSANENAYERMQAPRSLWDPDYTERSWICDSGNCPLRLIPHLKEMIDEHYPGTKLSFTEYEYGGGIHPSGGVALADVLGIFGKYGVYMANYWMVEWGVYTLAAFRLYRNYDGKGGVYGDTNVKAESSDIEKVTTYAALDSANPGTLHIIILNKDMEKPQTARVNVAGKKAYKSVKVWGFDGASKAVTSREAPAIKGNVLSITMPAMSGYHLVLTEK